MATNGKSNTLINDAQNVIYAEIDRISPELRELSLDLHNHPELGLEEHHAHEILTDYLEKNGFEVTRSAYDIKTAFTAKYTKGSGLRVGFCSEYDALPGIGHACGHNLIAVTGIANAMAMKALLEKGIASGTVMLFGTPSEEKLEGKILMARKGAFQDNVDVCTMLHPGPSNMNYWGATACNYATIEYRGKPSHAGGSPWSGYYVVPRQSPLLLTGVNALDAVCQAWVSIGLLRQQLLGTDRIHGVITDGGKAPNIIPDYTAASLGVRAKNAARVAELMTKAENCFNAAALATGCTVDIKWREAGICKNVTQNSVLAEMYAKYYKENTGKELPSRHEQEAEQVGASSDFGNVSALVPALHPLFEIYTDDFPHTHGFSEAAETSKAHDGAMIASKSLAMVGAHLFLEKEFFKSAYDEYNATVPKEQRT